MANQDQIIVMLQSRVAEVAAAVDELRAENDHIMKLNEELMILVSQKQSEIEEMQASFEQLKLAKTLAGSQEDIKNAKTRVDEIMREIDKCIALLNR